MYAVQNDPNKVNWDLFVNDLKTLKSQSTATILQKPNDSQAKGIEMLSSLFRENKASYKLALEFNKEDF